MNAMTHEAPRASLFDLLLRDADAADALCADAESSARLMPQLVGISTLGLAAFALSKGALYHVGFEDSGQGAQDLLLSSGRIFLAYFVGFFGTQIASLPSAYFYALLAGVKTHGWRVAVEALRSQATSALVLLGLVPVHLAVGLGVGLGYGQHSLAFELVWFSSAALPFLAGLAGVRSMHRNFYRLVRDARPEESRTPAPALLVLAWSALFTVLAPMGVYCMSAWLWSW